MDRSNPGNSHRLIPALARYGPPAALVLALLVLWQLAVGWFQIQSWLLPSPGAIVQAGVDARGIQWPHIVQTAQETLLGFAVALGVGLGLGLLIDRSQLLRDALYPLLVVSQTVPTIAIAPLLVIWFGYGIWPKIIVVGLICFFPIVVSTADGLRGADPELVALLRTMGASRWAPSFARYAFPGRCPPSFPASRSP
jgi:ABC-type nitrate/sulfonate/bicarbonate transport system permease component